MRVLSWLLIGAVFPCMAVPGFGDVSGSPTTHAPPEPKAEHHAHDPDGPCPVCALARRVGLRMTPLRSPHITRCCDSVEEARATSPRGVVRPEEMRVLHLDLGDAALDTKWRLEIRAGSRVVFSEPFEPAWLRHEVVPPPRVRRVLRDLRCELTWGLFAADGRQVATRFWVERPSTATRRVIRRVWDEARGTPLWIRSVVHAQALLDAEFDLAARHEAERVLAMRPREPHALAILQTTSGLLGFEHDCEVMGFAAREIRPIYEARREGEHGLRCDLDDEDRVAPVRRLRQPRGGCGG